MKKFIVGLMVLAVIGFGMAACGDDDDDGDIFAGTWKNDAMETRLVAANGSFTQYSMVDDSDSSPGGGGADPWERADARGTYTVSGNTVNATITHANTRSDKTGTDNWVAYASLTPEQKGNMPQNVTGTVSGSTFTVSVQGQSIVFTKVN